MANVKISELPAGTAATTDILPATQVDLVTRKITVSDIIALTSAATTENIQDAIGAALTDTSSIDLTYNDGANTISGVVLPAGVDHNSLANLTTGNPHTQYAQTTLSNLGTTAINADLIFDKANPLVKSKDDSIATVVMVLQSGNSSAAASGAVTIRSGTSNGASSGAVNFVSGIASGAGSSGDVTFRSGVKSSGTGSTGAAIFGSGVNSITGNNTGTVEVSSGNSTFANGGSGSVTVATGTTTGAGSGSGSLFLTVGSAGGGSQGTFKFLKTGVASASGQLWTASSTDGTGYWATPTASVTTLSAIGSTPNANAATITGSTLNLEPASASFGGVVTMSAQTLGSGAKTFAGNILASANQTLDIGALATRFRDVNAAQKRIFNKTSTATVNLTSAVGTDKGNYEIVSLGTAGTQNFGLDNGALFSSYVGYAYTDYVNAVTTVNCRGNGTVVLGGASVFGATNASTATVDTDFSAGGSAVIGAAYVNGSPLGISTATVTSTGLSSLIIGSAGSTDFGGANGNNTTAISNSSDGGLVSGAVVISEAITCNASMNNTARGSVIAGLVQIDGSLLFGASVTALMETGGVGGAQVVGFCSRGIMRASNQGSRVLGFCAAQSDSAGLFASGVGSTVIGRNVGSGSFTASGNAAVCGGNIGAGAAANFTVSGGGAFGIASISGGASSGTSTVSGAAAFCALQHTNAGTLTQSGAASLVACAITSTGTVTVSGVGNSFIGRAASTGVVTVSGTAGNGARGDAGALGISSTGTINCFQDGQGANSTASSNQFGVGIKLLHLTSVTPAANGQVGMDASGFISAYTGGVQNLIGRPYIAKTGNYTLVFNDYLVDVTSGTNTQTLPTAVGFAGKKYVIKNSGTGTTTVATTSSQTIDGVTTLTLTQYQCVTVISNGANWVIAARY